MKLFVTAKPNSRQTRVQKIDDTHFKVWVKEKPEDGKANAGVIAALAEFFDKPKSRFTLLRGHTSKDKTIELKEE